MQVHVLSLDASIEAPPRESNATFQQVVGSDTLTAVHELRLAINQVLARLCTIPPGKEWSLRLCVEVVKENAPDTTKGRWKLWLNEKTGQPEIQWRTIPLMADLSSPTQEDQGSSA